MKKLSILLLTTLYVISVFSFRPIPVTGAPRIDAKIGFVEDNSAGLTQKDLYSFIRDVNNGNSDQIIGLFVNGVLANQVVQQPSGSPGYVSESPDVITQFRMASQFGSTGFLAHNHLVGENFSQLGFGDIVNIVWGDGKTESFLITDIRKFQATNPTSPYSNFIDLDQENTVLSAEQLFYQTYGIEGNLILQTCIAKDNDLSWGRLFVIAEPINILKFVQNSYLSKVN